MTYAEMDRLVNHGRHPGKKKMENNTWLVRLDENRIGVQLHDTIVVEAHSDGSYTLDSGGWRTTTTKGRINSYAPVNITQKKGDWTLWRSKSLFGDVPFQDGMRLIPTESGDYDYIQPTT